MGQQPADITPFLKKGLHYSVADWLYRHIFQHFDRLLDRISAWSTRKWCEDNSPALRELNKKR